MVNRVRVVGINMLITDYTLNWRSRYTAQITWDGGATSYWYTIFVDGRLSIRFEDSGTIVKTVSMDEIHNHSIAIVRHDNELDDVPSPEDVKLLQPTIRWMRVDNAGEYEVRQVEDDGTEYIAHTEYVKNADPPEIFSWQVPVDLPIESLNVERIRVYARGSWGLCETPVIISGFISGHPPRANTITAQDTSTGIELQIDKA